MNKPFHDTLGGWLEGQLFRDYLRGSNEVDHSRHYDDGNELARAFPEEYIAWQARRLLLGYTAKLTIPTKTKED